LPNANIASNFNSKYMPLPLLATPWQRLRRFRRHFGRTTTDVVTKADPGGRLNGSRTGIDANVRSSSRLKRPRSAVTSGRVLLVGGDSNSAWARRYADLLVGHVADAGGRDLVSDAKLSLIRRAAAMECEIERLEAKLCRDELVDLDVFGRAASHLRRLFEVIGIERKQRDVTPNYVEGRYDYEDTAGHSQSD
jgi:hypothetical protein